MSINAQSGNRRKNPRNKRQAHEGNGEANVPKALYIELNRVMALTEMYGEKKGASHLQTLREKYPKYAEKFTQILMNWGWQKPTGF